ncbi:MAG: methyl-accepting chemotaxis protein [Rhodospirillaceae bacterium]|nr:methyl-accepting chemotaxis protein [Rhodospirillaceae bacterium]
MSGTQADVAVRNINVVAPLAEVAQEIQYDVVQVQQWITDISATRGQDGLNDGLEVAETYAKKFGEHTALALDLSGQMNNAELQVIIEQTQKAFPAYYEAGKSMAAAYIAGGPKSGNKLMTSFDGAAEAIHREIEKLRDETDKIVKSNEIEIREAASQARFSSRIVLVLGLVIAAVAILIAFLHTKSSMNAAKVISIASAALREASQGNLSQRVTRVHRDDEIGSLVLNLNRLMDLYEAYAKEAAATIDYAAQRKYYRKIVTTGLRGEFIHDAKRINQVIDGMERHRKETKAFAENDVSPAIEFVAQESSALHDRAKSMADGASKTIERSVAVSAAAEKTMVNVQTVASASEELSASIGEINRQTTEASGIANEAASEVERTNHTVATLGEAAQQIGDVIALIQDIADQTNLLALNATIEAARAGEAGKGFAVVASEVKNLANQTAKATEEIGSQVSSMQTITSEAVSAIDRIGSIITRMNENVENVTGAVEDQNAATNEISGNVQDAATGTQDVSAKIADVSSDAETTNSTAQEVLQTADDLEKKSEELRRAMDRFVQNLG